LRQKIPKSKKRNNQLMLNNTETKGSPNFKIKNPMKQSPNTIISSLKIFLKGSLTHNLRHNPTEKKLANTIEIITKRLISDKPKGILMTGNTRKEDLQRITKNTKTRKAKNTLLISKQSNHETTTTRKNQISKTYLKTNGIPMKPSGKKILSSSLASQYPNNKIFSSLTRRNK